MTREEQEQRKFANEMKRVEETALLCTEFLITNASDIELSNKTGFSSSTVGRRLTNQKNILNAFAIVKKNLLNVGFSEEDIPKNGLELYELIAKKRQENLLRGKALGGQTTLLNHVYLQAESGKFDGSTKLRLDVLYHTLESQYRFLIHAALTFRLHPDTLSSLFQIDEKELYENMIKYAKGTYEALMYLFYHDMKNQDDAKEAFLSYYRELLNAIRNKDVEEKKRLLNIISDTKTIEFKKEHQLGDKLSKEDILVLLNYQLKYALTGYNIESIFDVDRKNYKKRVNELIQDDEELRREYEYLMDYNIDKYKKGVYYGK